MFSPEEFVTTTGLPVCKKTAICHVNDEMRYRDAYEMDMDSLSSDPNSSYCSDDSGFSDYTEKGRSDSEIFEDLVEAYKNWNPQTVVRQNYDTAWFTMLSKIAGAGFDTAEVGSNRGSRADDPELDSDFWADSRTIVSENEVGELDCECRQDRCICRECLLQVLDGLSSSFSSVHKFYGSRFREQIFDKDRIIYADELVYALDYYHLWLNGHLGKYLRIIEWMADAYDGMDALCCYELELYAFKALLDGDDFCIQVLKRFDSRLEDTISCLLRKVEICLSSCRRLRERIGLRFGKTYL